MFKNSLLILMLMITTFVVRANSYQIHHDDYVHLPVEAQNQLVIGHMELVTELESKYLYEVSHYGYNQKRFELFQDALKKIQAELFVAPAYASDTAPFSSWKEYGNSFVKLLKDGNNNCLFGGWVSKTYTNKSTGKTYCTHPSFKKNVAVSKSYPDPKPGSGCSKNDPTKIQCNPAIFGFKKASDKSLFCVKASDGAHNSSYHCMKEALRDFKDEKTDSKEERLKFLREGLAANKEILSGVQDFVYKTCICNSTPDELNKNYHSYMRPHRTCYGLMGMVSETVACEINPLSSDLALFKELKKYTQEKLTSSSSEAEIDYQYGLFINYEVKKKAPAEFNRLCPLDPQASITVSGGPKPGTTSSNSPATPSSDGKNPTSVTLPVGEPTADGSGKTPAPANDTSGLYTCVKASCKSSDKAPSPTTLPGSASDEDETEVKAEIKPDYDCTFDVSDKEKSDEKVEFVPTLESLLVNEKEKVVSVKGLVKEAPVELSCPLEVTDSTGEKSGDDSNKPSLKVEITDKGVATYTVLATVVKAEGWKLTWSLKDKGNLEVKTDWKEKPQDKDKDKSPKAPKGMATDDEDEGEKAPEKKEEPKKAAPSDKPEIIQPRLSADYKVCAQLSKGTEKIPESPACVTIDKLKAPSAPNMNPNGMPRRMRGPVDMSSFGIK